MEGAEGSQVTGSKHKEIATRDKKGQWLSKKSREKQQRKYCGSTTVKMGGANPCERCVCTGQDCPVHPSRVIHNYTYYYYFLIIFSFIAASLSTPDVLHSSNSMYPTVKIVESGLYFLVLNCIFSFLFFLFSFFYF